jgi:hypothetical protein
VLVTISMFASMTNEENKCSWLLGSRILGGKILFVQRSVLVEASTFNYPTQGTFMRGALWDLYFIGRTMKLCVTVQRSVTFGSITRAQAVRCT